MKSLDSSVISSKLSGSNSHCAAVTRAKVSASLFPWNGDSPLSLEKRGNGSITETKNAHISQKYSGGNHKWLHLQSLQNIADDADAPQVSGQIYRFIIDDLWGHKLWSPMTHHQLFPRLCKGPQIKYLLQYKLTPTWPFISVKVHVIQSSLFQFIVLKC